jgi:hypothetical protein
MTDRFPAGAAMIGKKIRCIFVVHCMKKLTYIMIAGMMVLSGCPVPEVLPDVPRVEFKSFILTEKSNPLGSTILTGELVFDFEDGDGDIGFESYSDSLTRPDTLKYNLFLTLHEKVNGKYREIDISELKSKPFYRIPPLDREGQNKTLRGEIQVDIEYYTIDYDTLKYSFFIMDRAFHRSNVDTTSEIIFVDWKDR